jgi:hypothetical protein
MTVSHGVTSHCSVLITQHPRGCAGVYFGQLLGMADNLTFPLGHYGYRVHKIVPYGPVDETMQYLLRRAQVRLPA